MIVGIFLRNIKTYRRIHYIPLSTGEKFCGLVGANGVGKSSILEAIDCLFNERDWNLNIVTKRSGKASTNPYIVPVFILPKSFIKKASNKRFAEILSSRVWSITSEEINPTFKNPFESFDDHRKKLLEKYNAEVYLLPVGLDNSKKATTGIFDADIANKLNYEAKLDSESVSGDVSVALNKIMTDVHLSSAIDKFEEPEELIDSNDFDELEAVNDEDIDKGSNKSSEKELKELLNEIKSLVEYIYIPKEIDPELFTKLETKEIQVLMGETLREQLDKIITKETIDDINQSLKEFIESLSKDLVEYSYRTSTSRRQQNLKKAAVHNLVIEAFFGIRKLHKIEGEDWLPIGDLSSGEKHKAIIDVAYNLLHRHQVNGRKMIIAIDEPESSLHISACFDQINSLFEISQKSMQLFFATHWYGFFPVIDRGNVNVISRNGQDHEFDLISLGSYREEVKRLVTNSRKKLPHDIRLKSINDLVQSMIASIIGENPYNWIVCEGSSDKIYLEKYFEDIKEAKKLRIVPVGGAREIKKIYGHLKASYEGFKSEVTGKIVLIFDTDALLVDFETSDLPHIICKRIVNIQSAENYRTALVDVQSNPKAPPTEIEDALNGKLFYEVLKIFKNDFPDLLDFIDKEATMPEIPSYFALDLRLSEKSKLDQFFSIKSGENKLGFAQKYTSLLVNDYATPAWIQELKVMILGEGRK